MLITHRAYALVCTVVGAMLLASGCASEPAAIECATGIICPDGTQCAAVQKVCLLTSCGNGKVDSGEACDDGNIQDGDGCSPGCRLEGCGNGEQDPGEACDDGNLVSGDGCNDLCTSRESCGNSITDVGETCDDGARVAGDGCSGGCQTEVCGNSITDISEGCDDGNAIAGDGCSILCALEICGNGFRDPAEVCDDGNTASGDGCGPACNSLEVCGNGVQDVTEGCDDGNFDPADGCSALCAPEICGNNIRDPLEVCDDGNIVGGDGCSANCRSAEDCGNAIVDPGELCDDGNGVDGDTCNNDCLSGSGCGNGVTAGGEECDDGNLTDEDNCRANCQLNRCGDGVENQALAPSGSPREACDTSGESATCNADCSLAACGDTKVNQASGEQCDAGKDAGGLVRETASCDNNCTLPVCGDALLNAAAGELCDPGAVGVNTSTCDRDCTMPTCGDALLNPAFMPTGGSGNEACDDGNTTSNDGCSSLCRLEACGNGITEPGEQCDDLNMVDTDACRNNCRIPACGDGVASTTEVCDTNGNSLTCDQDCTAILCGDGVINTVAAEQCEDGGTAPGDGCSATCRLEPFSLSVTKGGDGSGVVTSAVAGINCGTDCSEPYASGAVVILTATPSANATFTGWSGACTNTTGTCMVTVTASTTATANFAANRLTVVKAGVGTGTVTSNLGGISCGATCAAIVNTGGSVTLTAVADASSSFTGFTGGGCSGAGTTCIVPMNQATEVTATFALASFNLTLTKAGTGQGGVVSAPTGVECDDNCSSDTGAYVANTVVTLFATAADDSTFTGWSNACTGTGPCVTTMSAARAVTATFALRPRTLTVTSTSGGEVNSNPAGITGCDNNSGTCSASFTGNSMVVLTATPNSNNAFVGWGGACTGTGTCTLTMDAAKAVSATFASNRLDVVRSGDGTGTITGTSINCGGDCTGTYNAGTSVTLTAAAGSGSTFVGWQDGPCDGSTSTTCTITMTGPLTVTAIFGTTSVLTLTKAGSGAGGVTSNPAGISCAATGCSSDTGIYPDGTVVTLTATPSSGDVFVGWSGGGCTGTGTCVVTLIADVTVTATFDDTFTLTGTSPTNGSFASVPTGIACPGDCTEVYGDGTSVTLTATPSSGFAFAAWTGACTNTSGTCTVTMSAAQTVGATFVALRTLTVTKTGTGTVSSTPVGIACGATCSFDFVNNTMVALTATPGGGFVFTGWGGACSGTGACNVTMDAAKTVTATFVPLFMLSVTKAGGGTGTVASDVGAINCGMGCMDQYASGTSVTLTATADAGSVFTGWSGACTNTTGTCVVAMDAAKTATATFAVSFALTVSKSGAGAGSVASAPAGITCGATCTASFASGQVVVLTATPTSALDTFVSWSDPGCPGTGTCSITMSSANSVTATFDACGNGLVRGTRGLRRQQHRLRRRLQRHVRGRADVHLHRRAQRVRELS